MAADREDRARPKRYRFSADVPAPAKATYELSRKLMRLAIQQEGLRFGGSAALSGLTREMRAVAPLSAVREALFEFASSLEGDEGDGSSAEVSVPDAATKMSGLVPVLYSSACQMSSRAIKQLGIVDGVSAVLTGYVEELRQYVTVGCIREVLLGCAATTEEIAAYDQERPYAAR